MINLKFFNKFNKIIEYRRLILIEYNQYLNAYICLIYFGNGNKSISIITDKYKIGTLLENQFLPLKINLIKNIFTNK